MNSSNEQAASILYIADPSRSEFLRKTKLFQIKDLVLQLEFPKKTLEKEKILNLLNYLHFSNERILVHLRDPRNETDYLAEALPDPALSDEVTFRWVLPYPEVSLEELHFRHLVLPKDGSIVAVPAFLKKMTAEIITVRIPEESVYLNRRRLKRYLCAEISVEIRQGVTVLKGKLRDFNIEAFRIRIAHDSHDLLSDINLGAGVQISMYGMDQLCFHGSCRIMRVDLNREEWDLIFKPVESPEPAERSKLVRNHRNRISPAPVFSFTHPLSGESFEREIVDISNSGVLVDEPPDNAVLIPGMRVRDFSILFSGINEIRGEAQAVRCEIAEGLFRCGLAFTDLDIRNYSRLHQILSMQNDSYAYVSSRESLRQLWEFFFDTGFIYPGKYQHLEFNKEQFIRTYQVLYQEAPEIAQHFIYKRFGKIHGHMSMVRAYPRSWLIHHHAGRSMQGKIPGFEVLKQIALYLHGIYYLPSSRIDYLMCYFRPENEFPDRVFGGFARMMADPRACSLDSFGYSTYHPKTARDTLPEDWVLREISDSETAELRDFYERNSGGMLLDATAVDSSREEREGLERLYRKLKFARSSNVYSLTHHSALKACFIVNKSDFGLNLSELLNGITVLILDQQMTREIVLTAVHQLAGLFEGKQLSLLIYPLSFLKEKDIMYEKNYQLWILKADHLGRFIQFMNKNFRMRFGSDVIA